MSTPVCFGREVGTARGFLDAPSLNPTLTPSLELATDQEEERGSYLPTSIPPAVSTQQTVGIFENQVLSFVELHSDISMISWGSQEPSAASAEPGNPP